jgi:urease accessory protein
MKAAFLNHRFSASPAPMRPRPLLLSAILAALCLLTAPAFAHHLPPGMEEVDEFADSASFLIGFNHPLTGWDHLLAALLTGVVAAVLLLAGFAAGRASVVLPGGEFFIMATVGIAGMVALLRSKCAVQRGAWVLAAFQAWHGNIHALEVVPRTAGVPYAAGLAAATLVLAALGYAVARLARRWKLQLAREARAAA